LSYNLGKNGNFLELGYGGSYVPASNVLLGPRLGYRREKKRTLIKLYTNPLFIGDGRIWPTSAIGFEIGRVF
jgi:hypothetical protein